MCLASKLKKGLKFFVFYAASFFVLLAAYAIYLFASVPDTAVWTSQNPKTTAFMQSRLAEGETSKSSSKIKYRWIPYHQVPHLMRRTLVVAEDAAFWQHHGIDWFEVKESIKKNWEERRYARGASTITQQLARNLYLSPEKTISRKIREVMITRDLEKNLKKSRILELYMNVVEWGPNVFGIRAASQYYFGKMPSELQLHEMVRLAAILPNPHRMNAARVNQAVYWRSMEILKRLRDASFISQAQFETTRWQLNRLKR
ncbi:MAG: monofunctional biosynthetic peptidoglycan transglycosylase [Calditrichia bacterium]